MNVAELDDDYLPKPIESNDSDEFQTPTNLSSNSLVKFNLGPNDDSIKANEVEDDQDLTLDENTINSNYPENNLEIVENKQNIINSYSQSLPQLPIHPTLQYINPYLHHGSTMSNLNSYFNQNNIIINSNDSNMNNFILNQTVDDKENQNRNLYGLYNDFKLTQFHFHSLDTFGFFIRYTLNLNSELVKEILSNHKIQHWIERNKSDGFVYNLLPKCIDESKHRIPVVRCELCKFYGHLSHNCLIKELTFKLYNVAIKSGACRCHICGQLGHPAEAGLCPYIACSFCRSFGHWNHMCPNIDKVSRTLCYKCQRYGHRTERCPDQWRQFDRISNYEQTPYKDPSDTNKPVYCYQCAKKGHYGHNCPDFYRKYFIRDNHQLNPVYFFAGSSPFVKFPVEINENDKKIINYLANNPIYDSFKTEKADQDPLELLELYQAKLRNENKLPPQMPSNLNLIFNENTNQTQLHPINMTFKKYIRKWSNWIIDFNWIFTLKFLVENLATPKLYFLIRNYPILDNFILHWMWWSYTLNKDLENFTKDSFRGIGSMPWLTNDINNNTKKKKNLNRKKSKKFKRNRRKNTSLSCNSLDTDLNKSKDENSLVNKPSLVIKQRFEFSTKTSIFLCDKYKKSVSLVDLIYEKELEKDKLNKNVTEMNSMKQVYENFKIDSFKLGKKLVEDKFNLTLVKFKSKSMIFDSKFLLNEIISENDEQDEFNEDLENTIVYLEKEKTAQKTVQNFEENKQEEDKQNDQINQVDEKSIIDDKKEVANNEQNTTSVFDKFVRSFSNGHTDTGVSEEDSKQQQSQQQSQQQPQQQQQTQQQQQQDEQQQNNQQNMTKKENNNENLHKLIDLLKKSNKIKNLDQGLIMTVSDLSNDKQCSHLDSAPTVEQIETEILATSKNLSLDSIDKQKQSDSSDLIKLLLKIDKNVTKPSNPPSINIIEKLQEKTKIDILEQSNVKLNLLDILKTSVSYQNDHGSNLINKILNSSNCTPINIDIVNQQIVSSSSSSSGSCLSLSSLSSISPQPSIFSSNSSPNSSSSSNSTTAKPNIDSSFSNSINSSKSNDQVSSSSMSLSSSSSSVSLESNSNKQNNQKKNLEINSSEEKISKIIQVETNNQELSNDNNQFNLNNNNNNMNSNNLKNFKNSKNYSKNHSNVSSYSNKSKQTNQYSKLNNLNRHFSLNNNNNNQNNRSFNNSKTSYSSFNIKQHNSSNQFSNLRNFQPNVNFQQNTSTSSSSSINVIQNNKFLKSNSIQNVQENNYQNRNFQMNSNTNNNFNFSSTSTSSTSLHKTLNSSVSTSQDQLNKIDQSNLNWNSNNSFNIVNTNQTNSNLNHMTSNETNNNYKNNGFIINKQINQRNQSCNYANSNQFKQQGLNGSQTNSSQNRRNDFRNQTYPSSLLQFQQIYNTNNSNSTSCSSTNSNSLSNSTINQKSNSTTSNSFISTMHKQSTNLNLIQTNYSNNSNNHNSYKKNQSNSFAISNSFNLRQNNLNSNYNNTNNNSNNNNNNNNNTKKNYKKN